MKKILLQFFHPYPSQSKINSRLFRAAKELPNVTANDLYEHYPDFQINVEREQELLLQHDVFVFQHPFYWYSSPALFKEWQDVVLQAGWAYGTGGNKLRDKEWFSAITTGAAPPAYEPGGRHRFTIETFLRPFEQTAYLCGMKWHQPLVLHDSHHITEEQIEAHTHRFCKAIVRLQQDGEQG